MPSFSASGHSTYTYTYTYTSTRVNLTYHHNTHYLPSEGAISFDLVGVVGMAGVRERKEVIQFLELMILQLVTQVYICNTQLALCGSEQCNKLMQAKNICQCTSPSQVFHMKTDWEG